MAIPEIEHRLRVLIIDIPAPGRVEMLRLLTIRDDAAAEPHGRLLIDCEEDRGYERCLPACCERAIGGARALLRRAGY